jgi:plasmid segregation protein ParM
MGELHMASWVADGEEFTVSDVVDGEDTRFEDFHWSPMNRVLVAHSLAKFGWSGQPIKKLYLGLPLRVFYDEHGEENRDLIDQKIANMRGAVAPTSGKFIAPVYEQIDVIAQGMAGFVDHMIDFRGRGLNQLPKTAAVIDVGGRTTDIAFIRDGGFVDMELSTTENIGVLDVHQVLAHGLSRKFNRAQKIEHYLLDEAVKTGLFPHRGQRVDVSDLVAAAIGEIETKLYRTIKRTLGNSDAVDLVLLIGGGAEVFSGIRQLIPHSVIAPAPGFANARGMWKFATWYRNDRG